MEKGSEENEAGDWNYNEANNFIPEFQKEENNFLN